MPEYLVPDYFPDFKCKIGACRHQCCFGWPISISMKDYFRLLGEDCNDDLRHRIDVSLHVCDNPTEERYAQICPRYDGRCAMLCSDGRCAIHAELGEDALPMLCRLYPRGVRPNFECSCANSCEAVIETLINRDKPLSFKKIQLDMVASSEACDEDSFHLGVRRALIRMMQERTIRIPFRLLNIGRELRVWMVSDDSKRLDNILWRQGNSEHQGRGLAKGLELADAIVGELDEHSQSLSEYGEIALLWFHSGDEEEKYDIGRRSFEGHFPDWEIRFENILVNQMFFSQFPFQMSENRVMGDGVSAAAQNMRGTTAAAKDMGLNSNSVYCEFLGLCMAYTLMRFLCIGNLAENPSDEHFVDVCAALFRLVSHTDFGKTAAALLNRLDYSTYDDMHRLMLL